MAVLCQKSVLDMIKEFRRNWHTLCYSERTTVCGADAMLLALQLSMAENNKQHRGEFAVSLSDVLLTWKYLLHDKLSMPIEDMEVVDRYEDIRRTYDEFLKKSNMLDLIDVYSAMISNCEINVSISPSQLVDFLSGRQFVVNDETNPYASRSPKSKHSHDNEKAQLLAKKIIYSYLNLLVNSKNDLAVAHILNIPDRGLGREAFTNLKYAAREKHLSIFLVATSFIRMIELGGKGYAPSSSDPLRTHMKGLSNFINFIDKLYEILGDIPNPSIAGSRIISVIKMELIKGQNSRDPFYKAIEEVAQDLDMRIKNIVNSQQGNVAVSTTDISPARPKSYTINHGTAYCGRDTVKMLLVLLDEEAATPPTKNKADLLYNDENTVLPNNISVFMFYKSPMQVNNLSMKPLRERIHKSIQEKKIKYYFPPTGNLQIILLEKELVAKGLPILGKFEVHFNFTMNRNLSRKMRQALIRSQFACTYKDDCMINKNKWNNVDSASETMYTLHMKNDLSESVSSSVGRPTIGTSSGNVHLDRSKNEKTRKPSSQTGNKSSKRKQVDLDVENTLCDNGNETPQYKNVKMPKISNSLQNKLNGKLTNVAKSSKNTTKDKLLTGQTKLTQFFRL